MSAGGAPHIIRAGSIPAWVRVRDLALTVGVWALFAWWVEGALSLIWDWLSSPMFELTTHAQPDWRRMWVKLEPFIGISALLATWLLAWGAYRSAAFARLAKQASAAPLDLAEHASRYGIGAEEVVSLRQLRVATVRVDADGNMGLADPAPKGDWNRPPVA
jgi:poly-beta-1,6-N-acetyl-D-glucosamine biosynthesis protein PgaD